MWRPLDLVPPGQRRTEQSGPCAPRLPPRTMGVPVKPGPIQAPTTLTPLLTPRVRNPQDPLTRSQRRLCRPHDATGESVNEHHLPRRNDGLPCAPLHYASECNRTAPPDRGRAPLSGRAILQTEATPEGRAPALRTEGQVRADRMGDDLRATARVARPPWLTEDGTSPRQPVAQENQPGSSLSTPDRPSGPRRLTKIKNSQTEPRHYDRYM